MIQPTPDHVIQAIEDLYTTKIYEDGKMVNGINDEFLMRLTLLRNAAGLAPDDSPLVTEAKAYFNGKS